MTTHVAVFSKVFTVHASHHDFHVRYMSSAVRLYVVCLSVTFVHPTQAIEIFGNISTPFGKMATY